VRGGELDSRDFRGDRVLLVFFQTGCKPCERIVPALNRVQQQGRARVIGVQNGTPETARDWTHKLGAQFPVVVQPDLVLSRRYQIVASPFAFLIDETGVIRSRGIVLQERHLRYVLAEDSAGAPARESISVGTE
jgi:peroxiredoxin